MATNKMKFEISIKELTFKFEGDFEQGQRIQTGISRALGDISRLQDTATGLQEPTKQIQGPVIDVPKRKYKKRRAATADAETPNEGAEGEAQGQAEESGERRTTGTSFKELLQSLKQDGFFNTPQTTKQMVQHFSASGHTSVKTTDLTAPLARMTRGKELKRVKNEDDVWAYSTT
jgi:hypothetical protein